MNCWLVPFAIETLEGESNIEVSTAAVTVNVAEPRTVPETAVMFAFPCATHVAKPVLTLMVATDVAEDDQLTIFVRLRVVPSL